MNHNEVLWGWSCHTNPPDSPDSLQFAYCHKKSTYPWSYIHPRNIWITSIHMSDFYMCACRSFNIIIMTKLISKLLDLGANASTLSMDLDFMTNWPQSTGIDDKTFSIIHNNGVQQECALSPLLYSQHTHDSEAKFCSHSIYKFTCDTTVVGQILNNDETKFRKEIELASMMSIQLPLPQCQQYEGAGYWHQEMRCIHPSQHRWC